MLNKITIGLFGTCGNSRWRDKFIKEYEIKNINYFNPQVENGKWHPGLVVEENYHFNNDAIILFPITNETTGQGSLAEVGFSLLNAIRQNESRYFIYLIDDDCNDPNANESQVKDSIRSRKLVKSKLSQKSYRNIFLTETLDDMLTLSIKLHRLVNQEQEITRIYKNVGT